MSSISSVIVPTNTSSSPRGHTSSSREGASSKFRNLPRWVKVVAFAALIAGIVILVALIANPASVATVAAIPAGVASTATAAVETAANVATTTAAVAATAAAATKGIAKFAKFVNTAVDFTFNTGEYTTKAIKNATSWVKQLAQPVSPIKQQLIKTSVASENSNGFLALIKGAVTWLFH